MEKTLNNLRIWRSQLKPGDKVLTRECRRGIINQLDPLTLLISKGHEVRSKIDDLFPPKWIKLVNDWRGRKVGRDMDIPYG